MQIEAKLGSFTKSPSTRVESEGVIKERRFLIGAFELSIKHPVTLEIPGDVERLLTGIVRKFEEWALDQSSKQS